MTAVRRVLLAAAVAVLVAAAVACAGGSRSAPATGQTATAAEHSDPRTRIEALDREIASEMLRAGVAQPPIATCTGAACATVISEPFVTPTRTDLQCRPAQTERCNDACTISTSICRNQEKICDLAKHLPGDDWAANKCESARASCKAAHDSCCTCIA